MAAWEFQMLQNVAKQNGWHQFISMQGLYNLLYREEEREMNPYCNAASVGLFPWSPLAAGVLARDQHLTSQVKTRERRMLAEFPTVAELLALAVAAGESPVAALDRVSAARPDLDPLAAGLVAALDLGLPGDSRAFARTFGVEHALVLRALAGLDRRRARRRRRRADAGVLTNGRE